MELVYLGITSAISLLSGVLFAWWTQSRQNRREREALAEEMTQQVHDRYEAYLALEDRIGGAIDAFDAQESALLDSINSQNEKVRSLEQALNELEGRENEASTLAPARGEI